MDLNEFIRDNMEFVENSKADSPGNMHLASVLLFAGIISKLAIALKEENHNLMKVLTAHNDLLLEIADQLKGETNETK